MVNSKVIGIFQLVEIPERGLMILTEVLTHEPIKRKFCFLKEDMIDVNEVLKK